jgi:hypothetical protein
VVFTDGTPQAASISVNRKLSDLAFESVMSREVVYRSIEDCLSALKDEGVTLDDVTEIASGRQVENNFVTKGRRQHAKS